MREIAETQVAVVGAGAVGTSVAYWLARRGVDTILLDRGPLCGETSGATFALVWVQSKVPDFYTRLSLLSADTYPEVVADLDEDVEYRRPGGIRPALTESEMAAAVALAKQQQRAGLEMTLLDGRGVRELEPAVGPKVLGGTYSPHDGHINSLLYVHALARAAERRGARIMTFTPVSDILRDQGGAVSGVVTPGGVIRARAVVNAAGVFAPVIAHMVGVRIPIVPCRGQVLITEALPPMVERPLQVVRQSPRSGIFLCGETGDFAGLDRSTTPEAMKELARRAIDLVPALAGAQAIRSFAGLRSWPPDGLPFLGPVSGVPGFYVAVGHSGITLSPVMGRVISDLVVDGRTAVDIAPYDPRRYDGKTEAVFRRGAAEHHVSLGDPSWPAGLLQAGRE